MKLEVIMFFILITLNSCSKNKKTSDLNTDLKIDASRVSIIKYDSTDLDCKIVFKTGTNSYLNNEDLDKIELAIDKIIEKQNLIQIERFKEISKQYPEENYKKDDFILKKIDYIRRYLVVKNLKGEKEMYVALVCNEIAKYSDFRKTLKQGHGGGGCLFSFKLNFDTNEYYDVQFNAEA